MLYAPYLPKFKKGRADVIMLLNLVTELGTCRLAEAAAVELYIIHIHTRDPTYAIECDSQHVTTIDATTMPRAEQLPLPVATATQHQLRAAAAPVGLCVLLTAKLRACSLQFWGAGHWSIVPY